MVQTKPRFKNFEDYLALGSEDLPEGQHEYVDGSLIELMPEGEENDWIANYLFHLLLVANITQPRLIRPGRCEVAVFGKPRTRFPDLVILDEAHPNLTKRRLTITHEMPAPRLVVEVISSGTKNRDRDLVDKRKQYAERGIPEYRLIEQQQHPEQQRITVLKLATEAYIEHGIFHEEARINSSSFGLLQLTAEQVLKAGD